MHNDRATLRHAAAFVEANGDELARARLCVLLDGTPPSRAVLAAAAAAQNDDGGFASFWSGAVSSLDATCFRLDQLSDFEPAAVRQPVERARVFLAARQRADGTWEEDQALAEVAPSWVRPGDEAARLYLTANCAFWLAGEPRRRAAGVLAAHVDASGRLPAPLHAHWLAAAVLVDRPRRSVLEYLGGRLDDLDAAALAWLANALPRDQIARAACSRLERLQADDGGWPSDGPESDVQTTLAAVRALRAAF